MRGIDVDRGPVRVAGQPHAGGAVEGDDAPPAVLDDEDARFDANGMAPPGVEVAIFDPETVGSPDRSERAYDLPGGAKRMLRPSRGIERTVVNGETVFRDGRLTGEGASGRVLRS